MREVYLAAGGDEEAYMQILDKLRKVFGELYRSYSRVGREKAMDELSSLLQVPPFSDDPDEFFISPLDFELSEFTILENFLNGKFQIITAFVRRALYRRKRQLGIYSLPDEYSDEVVREIGRREKLNTDLNTMSWFLSCASYGTMKSNFSDEGFSDVCVPSSDNEVFTEEEMMNYDNERRPNE